MGNSNMHNQRFAKLTFASVYPMYLTKVEKKRQSKGRIGSGYRVVDRFR